MSKYHHICHLSCIINAVDRVKYTQYFHFCYFCYFIGSKRLTFMSLFFLYIFGKNVFLRFLKNQFFLLSVNYSKEYEKENFQNDVKYYSSNTDYIIMSQHG